MIQPWKLVLATLLLGGMLAANAWLLEDAAGDNRDHSFELAWSAPVAGATAASVLELRAGEGPVIAVSTPRGLSVLGADGKLLREHVSATGLVAAAVAPDTVATLDAARDGAAVTLLDGTLTPRWTARLAGFTAPSRVLLVDLDADGRLDVVAGAQGGHLRALSSQGRPLWSFDMTVPAQGEDAELRGLDDARQGGALRVAAARRDGRVVVLDGAGQVLDEETLSPLRRLRGLDIDGDGAPELVAGFDSGACSWLKEEPLGQRLRLVESRLTDQAKAITEVRTIRVTPQSKERQVLAGTREGVLTIPMLFWVRASGKITALGGIDLTGDGRDEILGGTEEGAVEVYGADGRAMLRVDQGAKVEAILAVPAEPAGPPLVVVAGGPLVRAWRYHSRVPPAWYRPRLAAAFGGATLLVCAAVLLVALRPPRPTKLPPVDLAAVREQRIAASEARVRALLAQGAAGSEDAEERLRQLRKKRE